MFDPMFVPPRHHGALFAFAQATVPRLAPLFGNVYQVHIPAEDLERLRALGEERALLCPNHPTETDPIVMFWLSRMLRRRFNFLATRETLEGLRGRLLNHIGAYSVIRGFPDRESLRMTRRLLAEMDRQVVIFPEGQVYERNDTLLEFQGGVAQMGFWALEDLAKLGKEQSLPLVPIAIRYRCHRSPDPFIQQALAALEASLRLERSPKAGAYERLLRIGGEVLTRIEREEGVRADPELPFSERIPVVRHRALERVAKATGAEVDLNLPPADRLHSLYNQLRAWVGIPGEEQSGYDEQRYRHRVRIAAPLFKDLLRLQNFIAITGDYVAQEPTAERFLEVLNSFQLEVLGRVRYRAPFAASVRVAPPIRLEERLPEYRSSKREAVRRATEDTRRTIREMLDAMSGEATMLCLERGVALGFKASQIGAE